MRVFNQLEPRTLIDVTCFQASAGETASDEAARPAVHNAGPSSATAAVSAAAAGGTVKIPTEYDGAQGDAAVGRRLAPDDESADD